jgi:hypothetical protein
VSGLLNKKKKFLKSSARTSRAWLTASRGSARLDMPGSWAGSSLPGSCGALVYFDDIIIYSETFEEHLGHLCIVFNWLQAAGLKLNLEKCSFVKAKLEFLRHIISGQGIRTDPMKTEKVKNFPRPRNTTQLWGFLGLASYYWRFVPNFARIAMLLNKLLEKRIASNVNMFLV